MQPDSELFVSGSVNNQRHVSGALGLRAYLVHSLTEQWSCHCRHQVISEVSNNLDV